MITGSAALGRCDLFQQLSDSERDALFTRARMRKYAANENIFLMGSSGDDMVTVVSGTIRISVPSPNGNEVVLAILGPGEICGEVALLDGKQRTADANAATECSVVVLERRDLLAFFAKTPGAWMKLVDVLCARMRTVDHQMAEFALASLPERLARALLRLATSDGHAADGLPIECIYITQRELGNVIGATRESVNKHLRAWQRKGCVRIADGLIVITNRAGLVDLSGSKRLTSGAPRRGASTPALARMTASGHSRPN